MSFPILLVNDLPSLRRLKRLHLEEAGYYVDEVMDGASALLRLQASPEALVVIMNTPCACHRRHRHSADRRRRREAPASRVRARHGTGSDAP